MNIKKYIVHIPEQPNQIHYTFTDAVKYVINKFFSRNFPDIDNEQLERITEFFSSCFSIEPKKEGYFSIFPEYGINVETTSSK